MPLSLWIPEKRINVVYGRNDYIRESFANETEQLNRRADGTDLCVVAVTIDDWFYEMSPWETEENLFENSAVERSEAVGKRGRNYFG